jgi:methionyl-tRNA formyltransferase
VKIFVITDNEIIFEKFLEVTKRSLYTKHSFDFYYSQGNEGFSKKYNQEDIKPVDIVKASSSFIQNYELGISAHCKQLFPSLLVQKIRCINIHPGYNPYNRGWFPQVFSIINKLPSGVTIHEMDEKLDHGGIIVQRKLEIGECETSFAVYGRILQLEYEMIQENLEAIITRDYTLQTPIHEGNVNLKNDFNTLRHIELDRKVSYREAIDFFRAMTFQGHDNAYFYDRSGAKVFVEITLRKEFSPMLPQKNKSIS